LKIRGFVAKTGERGKNLVRHAANRVDVRSCNTELVGLYWQIGQYISGKLAAAVWGQANAASRAETCFACGNFSRRTTATRK
jgi:hypothetical protein